MEVQARSPFSHLLTPQNCRQRYRDLQRRFAVVTGIDGGADAAGNDSAAAEVPWLEELRKLRVAELRREVKELKEEHERSLQETIPGEREEDPEDDDKKAGGSPESTPGSFARDRISGGESGRSCNESNSTNPKDEGKPGGEDGKPEENPGSGGGEADPTAGRAEKAAGEGSYNGSSDTIAKGEAATEADLPRPQTSESGESVAESKGGVAEAEGEESSDVQSSASLSRRRKGRLGKAASGSSSGGDEQEADEDSLIAKRIGAESQPLVSFLKIIRSHEYGSVFERRLESQESGRYRSVIRQHVDLAMVRAKLERGVERAYTGVEFFRDLLLLCNNAIVFYPKDSSESTAAFHLRQLVAKDMAATIQKLARPPPAAVESAPPPLPPPPQPKPIVSKLKKDPDLAGSLPEKPSSSTPIIACRKRSSISNKAKKEERDEKHDLDRKEREREEQNLSAKKNNTRERSATRGLRTIKNRTGNRAGGEGGAAVGKSPNPAPSHKSKPVESTPAVETAVKAEKKNGGGAGAASMEKKRSSASFLNRIKRSSPSSNGTLLETLKGSSPEGTGRGVEQKKGGKGDRKDQGSRQEGGATYARKAPEPSAPGKRSVGRPPKRAVAPPIPTPAKRAREEAEAAPAKPPTASSRKRARK
ncbi:serine/arginine repetitive matrix protein 1 [Cocos nucifera]|uniref:Serine/arginine repetitive matrix protein 1 n=1 Tax=Cocos nucifera TaxID=13894 RepID=A0A8K0HW25_COCNU|nr:serine/arginine repetitive matrix protein 1 [Cocos nucifera]